MPYVITKSGTFGTVERTYTNWKGEPGIVIAWGPLGWLTPVLESACMRLRSSYELEARAEADMWLRVWRLEGEIDRMRPVYEAAKEWRENRDQFVWFDRDRALVRAIDTAVEQEPK